MRAINASTKFDCENSCIFKQKFVHYIDCTIADWNRLAFLIIIIMYDIRYFKCLFSVIFVILNVQWIFFAFFVSIPNRDLRIYSTIFKFTLNGPVAHCSIIIWNYRYCYCRCCSITITVVIVIVLAAVRFSSIIFVSIIFLFQPLNHLKWLVQALSFAFGRPIESSISKVVKLKQSSSLITIVE